MEQQKHKQRNHKVFSDYGVSDYYKFYKKVNKDIEYKQSTKWDVNQEWFKGARY